MEAQKNPDSQDPTALQKLSAAVNAGITRSFQALGRLVSRRPYWVIALCVVLTLGCAAAFWSLFEQELDSEDLYTPSHSQSFRDREYTVGVFGSPSKEVRLLATKAGSRKGKGGCKTWNLFPDSSTAKSVVLDYFTLFDNIQQQLVEYNGKVFVFNDVCVKAHDSTDVCKTKSILDIWGHDRRLLEADDDVLGTIMIAIESGYITSRLGVPIAPEILFGRNKEDGPCKGNVEILQMSLELQNDREVIDGKTIDPESVEWVLELVNTVADKWENKHDLVGYVSSLDIFDKESNDAISRDVIKLALGYILTILFSHVVLFKNSPVFCKMHLASVSVISVIMSIVTAFGLGQLFGVKFNPVVQTLPFILLGLGMDDTFVIMGAYHSTSIHQSVEDRMAETMARAGSSILVTSVTDVLAFVVGTYTQLPALQAFSIFAFLGITFDFIYQVTFFAAFVVLDARREQRAINGAPMLGFQCGHASTKYDAIPPMEAPVPQDIEKNVNKVVSAEQGSGSMLNGKNWKRRIWGKKDFDSKQPTIATRLAGELIPRITLNRLGSIVILLIEAVLIAASIYGCKHVKMDFRYREWFVPDESPLQHEFKLEKEYFTGDQQPFSVLTKPSKDGLDFFYHQDEYAKLVEAVQMNTYVAAFPPVTSWYNEFSKWLVNESPFKDDIDRSTKRAPNATAFNDWVRQYLNHPAGVFYKNSLIFGEDGIESTKFSAYTLDIKDGRFAVNTVDSVRAAAGNAAPVFDPVVYSRAFISYDGFRVIAWETIRNVLLAGFAVYIITSIVLANFVASSIVTLMIALTDVMLFGFLWYVDLDFNTVTAINMVVAVGIAVDYSAHIAHSFLVMKGSRKDRAHAALQHIGGEVIAGAFTTWLAISVMVAAEHFIFKTFFKMFFAIVVVGVWHGLIILPIMLSICGPEPYASG